MASVSRLVGQRQDLFAPLNTDLVPNLTTLYPEFPLPDGIGTILSFHAIGMEYNTDVFDVNGWDPPTSYDDLADPKYQGHVFGTGCAYSYTTLDHGDG